MCEQEREQEAEAEQSICRPVNNPCLPINGPPSTPAQPACHCLQPANAAGMPAQLTLSTQRTRTHIHTALGPPSYLLLARATDPPVDPPTFFLKSGPLGLRLVVRLSYHSACVGGPVQSMALQPSQGTCSGSGSWVQGVSSARNSERGRPQHAKMPRAGQRKQHCQLVTHCLGP